jgi:hypothetical protein
MAIRLILCFCFFAVMVIGTGCSTVQKASFANKLAEARQSLTMIEVDPYLSTKTGKEIQAFLAKPQPTEDDKKKAELLKKTEQGLDEAFNKMLSACQATLAGFESQGRGWGVVKISIAAIGTIAGAIAVPALTAAAPMANAAWIAGFGGVSGATNAAQQSLADVGFTPTSVLQDRQNILDSWKAAMSEYFAPETTQDKRKIAIQKGLAACTLYAVTIPGQQIESSPSPPEPSKQ